MFRGRKMCAVNMTESTLQYLLGSNASAPPLEPPPGVLHASLSMYSSASKGSWGGEEVTRVNHTDNTTPGVYQKCNKNRLTTLHDSPCYNILLPLCWLCFTLTVNNINGSLNNPGTHYSPPILSTLRQKQTSPKLSETLFSLCHTHKHTQHTGWIVPLIYR